MRWLVADVPGSATLCSQAGATETAKDAATGSEDLRKWRREIACMKFFPTPI